MLPDPVTLRVALAEFAGITGAASLSLADLVGLEAGLVIAIDGEGDGADQCLPEEPDAVLLAVDDVDAPEENAAEEEADAEFEITELFDDIGAATADDDDLVEVPEGSTEDDSSADGEAEKDKS